MVKLNARSTRLRRARPSKREAQTGLEESVTGGLPAHVDIREFSVSSSVYRGPTGNFACDADPWEDTADG